MKGGVLVIGSLLWDHKRKNWRSKRLNYRKNIHVKAPIRYGRYSGKRGKSTITMVLSCDIVKYSKLGTAYLIPCRNENLESFNGILNQARYLSEAEGSKDKNLCKVDSKNEIWCTIGILLNPKLNVDKKEQILQKWEYSLINDDGLKDYQDYCIGEEESILTKRGEMKIDWLNPVDNSEKSEIDSFDFILGACTKPNTSMYPTIEELSRNIKIENRKYFYQNIKHGITTYQDYEILQLL